MKRWACLFAERLVIALAALLLTLTCGGIALASTSLAALLEHWGVPGIPAKLIAGLSAMGLVIGLLWAVIGATMAYVDGDGEGVIGSDTE